MSSRIGRYRLRIHRWAPAPGSGTDWRDVVGGRVVISMDAQSARRRYRELRDAGDGPDHARAWLIRAYCLGEGDS